MTQDSQPLGKLRKIDPGKLKLRELAEIEKLLGRKIAGELQGLDLGIDTMQALLWMELRKQHPEATFEQAGEYDLQTLMDAFEDDEQDEGEALDPTRLPPSADGGSSGNGATPSAAKLPSITSGG